MYHYTISCIYRCFPHGQFDVAGQSATNELCEDCIDVINDEDFISDIETSGQRHDVISISSESDSEIESPELRIEMISI